MSSGGTVNHVPAGVERSYEVKHSKHDSALEEVEGREPMDQEISQSDSNDFDSSDEAEAEPPINLYEDKILVENDSADKAHEPAWEVRPATSTEFGELFPSKRKMLIQHDNTYGDAYANLRVDMHTSSHNGVKERVTMFHLKIHNREKREMSLRRYHRDSGREVCNCTRVHREKKQESRPKLIRSFSSALASLKLSTSSGASVRTSTSTEEDDPMVADDEEEVAEYDNTMDWHATNIIRLDFSNYAHIELFRKRKGGSSWHEFEYWGSKYRWKAIPSVNGYPDNCVYQLFSSNSAKSMASIVPVPLTESEALAEDEIGGWVDPCSFWVEDPEIRRRADVAE